MKTVSERIREISSWIGALTKKTVKMFRETKLMRKLPVYEIEKAEKRYEVMAAKGWFLSKRGSWFDRYRKAEPENRQYRLEYCQVKSFEGICDLSEDQVDFYEDCGWELVCERRGVYVFSAPLDSDPMDLYSDPQEQIRMLKSVHHYIDNPFTIFVSCYTGSLIARSLAGQTTILSLEAFYCTDWVSILTIFLLIKVLWDSGYASWRCRLLIRRVKKGLPIHHLPGEKPSKHRIARGISGVMKATILVSVVGVICLLASWSETKLSELGNHPIYLRAEELYDGVLSDKAIGGMTRKNTVQQVSALTSEYYEVEQYMKMGESGFVSMDQKAYVLRDWQGHVEERARALADSLLKHSAFGDEWVEVIEHPDFDFAARARYALVAVKDNRVIRVTCIASGDNEKWEEMLELLAEKWGS